MIHRIFGFLKSPPGKVMLFVVLVIVAFSLVGKARQKKNGDSSKVGSKLPTVAGSIKGIQHPLIGAQVPLSSVRREFKSFRPGYSAATTEEKVSIDPARIVPPVRLVHAYEQEVPPTIKIIPKQAPATNELPPGLFIPCRLFNGIESNLPETPLVATVTEDVMINGVVVVPKGSEIHGSVRADDQRSRVMTGSSWQVVTPSKKLIRLQGIGLNREYDAKDDVYGRKDGLAGIAGEKIKQGAGAAKGVFLASAVSTVGRLGQSRRSTLLGSDVAPTLGNGVISGASGVMDRYAEMKLKEVAEQRPFVRVAAGTEFYVYTQKSASVVADQQEEGINGILKQRQDLLDQLSSGNHAGKER